MEEILRAVHVHIPYYHLRDRSLPLVLEKRINPEISFNAESLSRYSMGDYEETAARLQAAGLAITFHAPFMDLRPGAIDPEIRRVSCKRIAQVLRLIPLFRPRSVVCHPSFDHRYYVSTEEQWVRNSVETWTSLAALLENVDTILCLENVYEVHPAPLRRVLDACPADKVGFCFDTGHFNCFSQVPLKEWIDTLAPYIKQLHLHDNTGQADQHLPLGDGTFPFPLLFALLKERSINPILTIEAHREEDLGRFLSNIKKLELL
ncbi:MAG: sugar phosphate isomerase/epimerase [Syntrophales bacterium]|nr:sugar phosphate isomerase/epimerase [Syntrophales bacterium]